LPSKFQRFCRSSKGEVGMSGPIEEVYSSLNGRFRGDLLRPEHPEFAEARRIWNGMVARTPGLIARCASVPDVQAVVRAASTGGVFPAIRCGGHSLAGFSSCEGGLVIDLGRMRHVSVDETSRRARFGGGCLLGTVDTATQAVGLVFPAGVVSHTGAAGLVLGGGTGWLNRLHGLSCDNVEGFTLVVADGSVLHASATENPDLFWALRGGGGNFGVVTEFEVRLLALTTVLYGTALHMGTEIPRVLQAWRDFMPESPDNLRWGFSLTIAPNSENVPSHVRGIPVASAAALWAGDLEEGRRYVDRVLSFCNPVAATKQVIPFLKLQTMADSEFPHGRRYYTKSGYFQSFNDESIHTMVEALGTIPSPTNQIELAYLGGAAARVSADETAFGDRTPPFVMNLLGNWLSAEDDDANLSWVRNLFAKLRPAMVPGVYVNFMSGDEDNRVPEAYRNRWERLVGVKTQYDPGNLFRMNQNIPPQKTAESAGQK
jgi:FAD binding domain-containing protein/berberine-like enzyme